jgi:Ca2+-binding EF-hand superfamily protein
MPESGLTTQQRKEVESAFRTFDTDGGGNIDAFELKLAMRALGMKMTEEEIAVIMEEVDVDKSGELDLDEFMEVVRPGIGGKDALYDVKKCFSEYFDVSGDGKIDLDEFHAGMPCFGADDVTERELDTAFKIADRGGKGYVDLIDWIDLTAACNLGPSYSEYEMAEVTLIRESMEAMKEQKRLERWRKMTERQGVDYNTLPTLQKRFNSIDVHDFCDLHHDPDVFVPPKLPPAVERRVMK